MAHLRRAIVVIKPCFIIGRLLWQCASRRKVKERKAGVKITMLHEIIHASYQNISYILKNQSISYAKFLPKRYYSADFMEHFQVILWQSAFIIASMVINV